MQNLTRLLAFLTVVGCGTTKYTTVEAPQTSEFALVMLGNQAGYLIDPRTETCLLVFNPLRPVGVAVDCAKVKKSVPEAAHYITWDVQPFSR